MNLFKYCFKFKLFSFIFDQFRHSSVISVRFKYTLPLFVVPPLSCSLQYIIPDSTAALISNLINSDAKNDLRITEYNSVYAKLIDVVTETSKMLENDSNWFINTHWRVARSVAIDKQNQISISHSTDKLIEESENNDERKISILTQSKIFSELPDDGNGSVAVASSEILPESENLADVIQIQITATTDNNVNEAHNITDQFDQSNNFPITDGSNLSKKEISSDGHDSGFISGKDITNT
ncbi:unnamed protein product [Brugia pahangi]|uniref:PAP_fibrillin domain-containing protein n=1 Tax=Brugia pahangi TaxID=6280 RepID=A0A0N4T6U4_BRUPA|nr:unnamed protein product [Brugia pahangi]